MGTKTQTIYSASGPTAPVGVSSSLDKLVGTSHGSLYEIRSRRIFDYFPDHVIIYVNRVTLTYSNLWGTDEFPILIENVTGARVYRSGIYASLSIDTFGYKDNPKPVTGLRQNDARTARRYILALIECKKAKVDLSEYSIDELRVKLLDIGKVRKSFT